MKKLDDFRLSLNKKEYVPLIIGGMGVDISSTNLALVAAKCGGIGHISDAMITSVSDRYFETNFVKQKFKKYKYQKDSLNKAEVQFNLEQIKKATQLYIEDTMNAKKGDGAIFVNCMEKLTMNSPKETLKARLDAALDFGIDGVTLSAGLHLGTFSLIQNNPRFRDVQLGIIVSSVRALRLFLLKAKKTNRLPDYIIVEGPLAGGHLGFGEDWKQYDLKTIVQEILLFLKKNDLTIPIIPAGGVFTGTDAVEYIEAGASGVQVATRFTISKECGLPDKVKQDYVKASKEDIIVSNLSPTGYLMRVLKTSPALGSGIRPNCESFGFLLDQNGNCAYIEAYNREVEKGGDRISVKDKSCLCTHMRNFTCWTCGHYTYRLKDTTHELDNEIYQLLDAQHIFQDYQFSTDHQIKLPKLEGKLPLKQTA